MCTPNGNVKFVRVVRRVRREVRLHAVGQVVRGERARTRAAWIENDRARRAPDPELAVDELEVVLGHLQLVRGDRAGLVDDLAARAVDRDAADGRASATRTCRARGARSRCRSAAPRRPRAARRASRPRSSTSWSRGPDRADVVPVTTSTMPGGQEPHGGVLPTAGAEVELRRAARLGASPHISTYDEMPIPRCLRVAASRGARPARRRSSS